MASQDIGVLKSRAELSNYEETSRYEDVIRFVQELQTRRGDLVRFQSFGETEEKRALPLMILANPAVGSPKEAAASRKPVVFVMANIHGGEVEGKEAMLHLSRRLVDGDLRPLLDKLIVLIAPDYNADGNEKISTANRTDQNGPIGGVGTRENSKGLDLNRDYMKLDSSEAKALVQLMAGWDPALTVDLHTTDGSYHGYHLTYSPMLNPNADPRLIAFERDKMLPAITQAMLKDHHFRTYYYGNFSAKEDMQREFNSPAAQGGTAIWRTFDHRPRFGSNYVGLRNRLSILSEAYSHLSFKGRVEVTAAFVEEILKFSAAHSSEILKLIRSADAAASRQLGVAFDVRPVSHPVDILVGEVEKIRNPRSGRDMTAMVENKFKPKRMPDYGVFAPTRLTTVPSLYIFRPESQLEPVVKNLRGHGIKIEELAEPVTIDVDAFEVNEVNHTARSFQGHNETSIKGTARREKVEFPAGSYIVRTAQPLSRLIFYLLEPESDDGLTTWNYFDGYLSSGKTHPVYKVIKEIKLPIR